MLRSFPLKNVSPWLAVVALAAVACVSLVAQQSAAPPPPRKPRPAPTNLQVLPKTMSGDEVHDVMHKWEADLGADCSSCHTADPKNLAPNGKPRLNFADDSKPEKQTARLMFQMTEAINAQYVSKVENSGAPVTCGTCHRGHLGAQPFMPPAEKDHEKPAAPPVQAR